MPNSKRGSLSIGKESTWGTGVAPGVFINATEGVNTTREQLRDGMQYQTLGPAVAVAGRVTASGSINDHQARADDLGEELRAAMGAPTTSGAGPYTHTFARSLDRFSASGAVLPPYSLIKETRSDLIERYLGGQCTSLTLTQNQNDTLMVSSSWIFKDVEETTSPTYVAPSGAVFKYNHLAITRDTVAVTDCFQSVTVTIDNALDAVACLNATNTVSDVDFGNSAQVTLSATALFNTTQQYDDFVASTSQELELVWTNGTNTLTLTFHQFQFAPDGFSVNLGGDRVLANISGVAEYSSSDSTDFTAVLVNSTASY